MRKRPSGTNIHPTSSVGQKVLLGKGVVISPQAIINDNVSISDNSVIGPRVTIGEPDKRYYEAGSYEFQAIRTTDLYSKDAY
ncbi:MAG: hypothetical protein WCV56_03340 [Candidatus Omnitrophota bacterium]